MREGHSRSNNWLPFLDNYLDHRPKINGSAGTTYIPLQRLGASSLSLLSVTCRAFESVHLCTIRLCHGRSSTTGLSSSATIAVMAFSGFKSRRSVTDSKACPPKPGFITLPLNLSRSQLIPFLYSSGDEVDCNAPDGIVTDLSGLSNLLRSGFERPRRSQCLTHIRNKGGARSHQLLDW